MKLNRYEAAGIALMGLAVALGSTHAKADTVRVILAPATVAGIHAAPVPHGAYATGKPIVTVRPSAGIMHTLDAAPANGCATPAFRVMSGPVAERGCYGSR